MHRHRTCLRAFSADLAPCTARVERLRLSAGVAESQGDLTMSAAVMTWGVAVPLVVLIVYRRVRRKFGRALAS